MDLVAPNADIMRTGFVQVGIVVVFAIVAALRRSTSTAPPVIWLKLNAPLVSIALGEIWALASYFLFQPVPAIDEYFVVGVWIAGGSGLVGSLLKDATDGSMGATSVGDVQRMRKPQPRGRNIGV